MLSTLTSDQPSLECVFYDNACALGRYARAGWRVASTHVASRIAGMMFKIGSVHIHNHVACTDPTHMMYTPEVSERA